MCNDLKKYYTHLRDCLDGLQKEKAVGYAMALLTEKKVSLVELYEQILTPILNGIVIERADEDGAIWKEHAMTSIVRTIVECAYPFVVKKTEKDSNGVSGGKVMILCPEEEYHELGARMGADFYALNGFEVCFIGANTPMENFISAYNALKPDIVSISVTNYLNLISLKKIVKQIREKVGNNVKIVLSGSAFTSAQRTAEEFDADIYVANFEDIKALRRDNHETGI